VGVANNCYIAPSVVLRPIDGVISIGESVSIQPYTYISGQVDIGEGTRIANKVSIHAFNHGIDRHNPINEQPLVTDKITIEKNVWIGTNSVILSGVTVGEGAVVAAGSVVTSDVPEYCIVAGVPAEKIDERS
jgi:maltose O-acetyltransferase